MIKKYAVVFVYDGLLVYEPFSCLYCAVRYYNSVVRVRFMSKEVLLTIYSKEKGIGHVIKRFVYEKRNERN